MKHNRVKSALKAGEAQVGTWLTGCSTLSARLMARTGFHWLTVDVEHSPVDWETAAAMFGAIADAGGVPLARVPFNSLENVKRALDSGAYGIIFPMCNSREEAEAAVSACKYPPLGNRSVGGNIHALNFDCSPGEYYAHANEEILVIIQAEHRIAVENADAIFSVPGVDVVFVGPNDLLSSMHKTPAMETDDPEFVEALRIVRETADRYGVAPGIHVGSAEAAGRRLKEGWRFIAVSSELGFMQQAAQSVTQTLQLSTTTGEQVRY